MPLSPTAPLSPTRYFLNRTRTSTSSPAFKFDVAPRARPRGFALSRPPRRAPPPGNPPPRPSPRRPADPPPRLASTLPPDYAPSSPLSTLAPSRDLSGQPGSPSQGGPSRPASPPGPSPRQSRQLASPGEPVSRLATGPPPLSAARSNPDHPSASAQHLDPAPANCLGHLDQSTAQLSYLTLISQPDPGSVNRLGPISPSRAHGRPTDRPGTRPRTVPGPARARTICPSASKTACSSHPASHPHQSSQHLHNRN